jgi:2-polyprenyl-6-methoxyphenol hydroxylase-like FAD-dependent oxidoreductase
MGRVTLVGDAASCVSLFGDGSSLAIRGAYTLADFVVGDIAAGLRRYEAQHRRHTAAKERDVRLNAGVIVPATATGIAVRNLAARLWPLVATAQRVVRLAKDESPATC